MHEWTDIYIDLAPCTRSILNGSISRDWSRNRVWIIRRVSCGSTALCVPDPSGRLLVLEAERILKVLGAEKRVFEPTNLPVSGFRARAPS